MTKAKWVSVSEDGAVWSVWQDGGVYKRVGNGWQKNVHAGNVEEVTVGWEINVWCRNASGELFKAIDPQDVNTAWKPIDLQGERLKAISSGPDGSFWAVTTDGNLLKRKGVPDFDDNNTELEEPETPVGNARAVSTGGVGKVVYVNNSGFIFEQFVDSADGKKKWREMERPEFGGVKQLIKSISYSREGVIWAVAENDELHKRQRSAPHAWNHNGKGTAVQISTGGRELVWCVNRDGEIFRARSGNVNTIWETIPLSLSHVPPGGSLYTVRPGDTLSGVLAARCPSVSAANLNGMIGQVAKINGITDPDRIAVGQVLILPPCP